MFTYHKHFPGLSTARWGGGDNFCSLTDEFLWRRETPPTPTTERGLFPLEAFMGERKARRVFTPAMPSATIRAARRSVPKRPGISSRCANEGEALAEEPEGPCSRGSGARASQSHPPPFARLLRRCVSEWHRLSRSGLRRRVGVCRGRTSKLHSTLLLIVPEGGGGKERHT